MENKSLKIIIISLLVFTLVAISTTYVLIKVTIDKKTTVIPENTESGETIVEEEDVYINLGIDPKGTFNENSINWIEQAYDDGEKQIKYYKISGLKDKTIENKVNARLKEVAFKHFEPVENMKLKGYTNQTIEASFGNVISVYQYTNIDRIPLDGGKTEYKYENEYININLVTGENLEFKDLFVDENAMLSIIYSTLYESEAWKKQWEKETDPYDGGYEYNEELWDAPILNLDEDEMMEKLYFWKNTKVSDFNFTSSTARAEVDDEYLYIEFIDLPSAIAIYNKFLTEESIYEDDTIGLKNIINLSSQSGWIGLAYSEYNNDKDTNLFSTARVFSNLYEIDYETTQKINQMMIDMAKKDMIEIDRQAMAETDKYHGVSKTYYADTTSAGKMFYIHEDKSYYFTDIANKDEMYERIVAMYTDTMNMGYGITDLYIDLEYTDENKFISGERTYDSYLYSLKTFERIDETKVGDFFMDGVDYEPLVKAEFNKLWYGTYGVFLDEARLEEEYNNTEFEFDYGWESGRVRAYLEVYNQWLGYRNYSEDYRDTGYKIYFDVFNPDDLKI